jgi:hypothetical protein
MNGTQDEFDHFGSLALWQITSTARLKARPKATASQIEALVTKALIIMIRLNKATITVNAFFSVKYFFITMDLHETKRLANINSSFIFSVMPSAERTISSTKFCYNGEYG